MKSKEMFAKYCMPELRKLNIDLPGTEAPITRLPSQTPVAA
jgi:hypothetical protein